MHINTEGEDMRRYLIKNSSGFTLVELVMVIIIIGMLAAIVIPNFTAQREQAAVATTQANLESLRTAIALYYANEGSYDGLNMPPVLGRLWNGGATGGKKYLDAIPMETISTPPTSTINGAAGMGGWSWDIASFKIHPNNPKGQATDVNGKLYSDY
jgi:type II secretion system protein G